MAKSYFTQNQATCETGPGSPSGHVMANIVLAFVIYDAVEEWILKRIFTPSRPGGVSAKAVILSRLVWNVLLIWQALVAVSRIYNLNHFPHQLALAWIVGETCCQSLRIN